MLHHGQELVREDRGRFKVVSCGRRWGKTELGKFLLVERALMSVTRGWWLAPTRQMASQVWRDLRGFLLKVDGTRVNEDERRIDLANGSVIAVRSTHYPDNLRGEGLDFAVLDEAAFMDNRVWAQVVQPMLITSRGGAAFLSTPCGRNWFWDLFCRGQDGEHPEWRSFRFPTSTNSMIAPQELESIRRTVPARVWESEYEAQFSEGVGQVFRRLREAVHHERFSRPQSGHRYVAGIDWGRDVDYTVIMIMDATCKRIVAMDRFNQIGWRLQRGRLRAMAERWRPQVIWAEANSIGEPNIEALIADGLPIRRFMTTARSKPPLIDALALAIESGRVALLDDPVLLGELAGYTQERLPGGGHRYQAPSGSHDDTVMAAALAWHAVENGGVSVSFV